MRRIATSVLVVLVLSAAAAGKDEKKKLNVTFDVGWGGCFRATEWTPVLIEITIPFKKPLACVLTLSATQDELNSLRIRRYQVLMPGGGQQVPLVTKLTFPPESCHLSIQGTETGFYWGRDYELWNAPTGQPSLTPVESSDLLIGISGKQGFGIMQLPRRSACRARDRTGTVYVKHKFRRRLPPDWAAYASLDLLVLYDVDWDLLTPHQSKAIAQWVTNGGRLLVILGRHALPDRHPIAALLPFQIGPTRQVRLDRDILRRNWGWGGHLRTPQLTVPCWSLEAAESAPLWKTRSEGDSGPLMAYGPAGFGRVGVFGFDPSLHGGRQDRSVADFWVAYVKPLLGTRQIILTNHPSESEDNWSYRLGREHVGSNAVLEHLLSLEELRPMHIGWVVSVLVLLAVLIGPVDYLVLKRLGRLPMTWVTASACIVLFSVGAYYGVGYIRGGVLRARVVSVVDGIEGTNVAWATRYCGIFAPQSGDYSFDPNKLHRGQWFSGLAPAQSENLYAYRHQLGSRNIYCQQHIDGGNLPFSLPINIWSMQCLLDETTHGRMPLRAQVRRDGSQWVLTVENLSQGHIERGCVVVGSGRAVRFGSVPAGESREFRGRAVRWRPWTSYLTGGMGSVPAGQRATEIVRQTACIAQGSWRRTEGLLSYVADGAAVVCAEFDDAPAPYALAGRKCLFEHKQIVRLVVFPQTRK